MTKVRGAVTSKVCWWCEHKETRGCEVKHRRRILAQKGCRGSNNTRNGQELRRRTGETGGGRRDKRVRRGKRELGKRAVKTKRSQQGYAIFYSNGR